MISNLQLLLCNVLLSCVHFGSFPNVEPPFPDNPPILANDSGYLTHLIIRRFSINNYFVTYFTIVIDLQLTKSRRNEQFQVSVYNEIFVVRSISGSRCISTSNSRVS